MKNLAKIIVTVFSFIVSTQSSYASQVNDIYPTAIFDFVEKSNTEAG